MHRHSQERKHPSAAQKKKQRHAERDHQCPFERIVSCGGFELAGQRDEVGRNPKGINDNQQREKRLQSEFRKTFIHDDRGPFLRRTTETPSGWRTSRTGLNRDSALVIHAVKRGATLP